MKHDKIYIYHGINIYYAPRPGYKLPYSAYVNGLFRYADTLAGIKKLIREYLENN